MITNFDNLKTVVCAAAMAGLLFGFTCLAPADTARGEGRRPLVLEFPQDVSVGKLVIVPRDYDPEDKHLKGKFLADSVAEAFV